MTTDSPLAVIFNQVFHQIFELQFPVQVEIFAPFTFFDVFAAMPPWQSWSQSSWNNWRDDKNKYQYDSEEALQFPEVETPNSWKSTNTFYDENVFFGLQFHRTIQPTSWSRKRGLTGPPGTLSKSQPPKAHSSEPPTLTAEEILTPGKASLKDQPPTGSSDATVKKWLQQYPKETQQMVVKLQAIISESKPKKDEIQTAAVQYGLNLNLVNKMSFSSLLKVISLGALQAA